MTTPSPAWLAVFTELTGRTVAQQLTDSDPVHLHAAVQAAAEALIVIDANGIITLANTRCSQLFGAPVLPGRALRDLLDARTVDVVDRQLTRRAAGEQDRYEVALARADGAIIWLLVFASPMFAVDGQFLGSVALLTDITTQKTVEHRLQAAALTDPLTGVANRATLTDRLTHALACRDAGIVAALFCDVDDLRPPTTNSATPPATSSCARSPAGSPQHFAPPTPSPATAGTSSSSSATSCTAPPRPRSSPSASDSPSRGPTPGQPPQASASASPPHHHAARPTSCSPPPTPPPTPPSEPDATRCTSAPEPTRATRRRRGDVSYSPTPDFATPTY